jgi:hypothetical protein
MDAKRRLYDTIVQRLAIFDVPANDVLIVLHEPILENWGIDGGAPARRGRRRIQDRYLMVPGWEFC